MIKAIKKRIDAIEIKDQKQAKRIVKVIPASCPFNKVVGFGKFKFEIPPLCKWNPTFENLMMLRFKALCYLDDHQQAA